MYDLFCDWKTDSRALIRKPAFKISKLVLSFLKLLFKKSLILLINVNKKNLNKEYFLLIKQQAGPWRGNFEMSNRILETIFEYWRWFFLYSTIFHSILHNTFFNNCIYYEGLSRKHAYSSILVVLFLFKIFFHFLNNVFYIRIIYVLGLLLLTAYLQ